MITKIDNILWRNSKNNNFRQTVLLLCGLSLFSWQCGERSSATEKGTNGTTMECSPNNAHTTFSPEKMVLLSNHVKVQATVDTSKWPSKPWPEKMIWIPTTTFSMGGFGKEARADEFPVHKVTVDGFWIDQTEVTNAAFKKFVDATHYVTTAEKKPEWEELKKQLPPGTPRPSDDVLVPGSMVFTQTSGPVDLHDYSQWWKWEVGTDWKNPNSAKKQILKDTSYNQHPVVQVSWYDAVAFSKWMGKRIPTEAEWECAAREGKEGEVYGWGNDEPDNKNIKANIWQGKFPYDNSKEDGYVLTAPVGSYAPNGYGLYDMMGNVWEWCSDWYRMDTYATLAKNGISKNPKGPVVSFDPDEPYASKRVVRGGSFLCNATYCASYRPSARMKTAEDTGENHTGFRCVMTEAEWRTQLKKK